MQKNSFEKIPDGFLKKWQEIADLIANIVNVPAALIMKTENEFMEVFTSSKTENNPYKVGDTEHWYGLYCETVIKTQKKLRIPNALKDKHWDKNPDIKLGMIAYLGFPINFPDKTPFGTLCVLDNKERKFSKENEKLLEQFKKVIELDLALIFSLGLKEKESHADIIQKLVRENEEYQAINEELKMAEQVLRESEDRLSKIMIAANDGMYDWDLKTNKVYFDPRYYQMSGYDVDEFPHNLEEFQKRVHPDDVDYVMNEAEKHLKGETNRFSVKFRFRKKSGDWQWIQGKGIIVERDEKGEPQRFVGTHRDISELKQVEETLKESEETYRNIFQNAQVGLFRTRISDGKILESNKQLAVMFGYDDLDEFIAEYKTSGNYVDEGTREKMVEMIKENGSIQNFEARFYRKDKSVFWAKYSARIFPDKGWIEGIVEDITEKKLADESLRESEERFQKMLGVVPDMISIQNPEMDILYSNWQGFATVPKNKQILNTKCFKTYRNFDDICPDCLAKSVLESRKSFHKETRLPDGTWFDIRVIPIIDKNNNVEMFMEWVRDITESKHSEEKLKSNYELLRIAGETARFGGWDVDLKKYISHWSDAVADIHEVPHGYSPPVEEGINFYAPEWREKITEVFTACAEKGIPYDEEMEIITSKGKRVWVRTNGRAVKDENGRIIKVHGSFQDITERRQAEEALRQSENFTRTILDNMPIGIAVNSVDPEVRFSYMNDKFPEIYRTTRKKLEEPDSFWKAVYEDPQFREELRRRVLDDCASGDPKRMRWTDIPVTRQGEKTSWIMAQNTPIPNQPLMISIVMDISEVKQAQEALQRIEWMLSKKAAAVKREKAPAYGDLSELNTSGLILDSVGKNVLKDIADDFMKLLESSSAIYEKNGDYALGIFASGWCRFMDQASRELCETDDNTEALDCGKWFCHDSCWKEASQPAMESGQPVDIECQGGIHLYALPIVAGDEVIGAINFGYGDPPQDKEKLSELAEKYKVPLEELVKRAREYESRPSFIIETAKDRLQASANLIGEIVSRKIAEREIIELNEELEQRVIERTAQLEASNKELEAFSYSVSHDLRAPLRHINGYVDLLNENFREDLPEKAQYYLTTVTNSATQMGTLIDELLQLSRTGRKEVRKTKMEMNALVKEVIEKIKQDTEKREINWKIQKLPQVSGDYSLLKQVWANLLDNAVKYTRNTQKAEISVGYKEEEKNFVFFVRDNGVGFNMKYAHKLFGVFQRLHSRAEFEGTGIGLANVQRIIHKHNGRVWAEAEPGKGARFFFSLPKVGNK